MPTPSLMILPKSKSALEFEYICTDYLTDVLTKTFLVYGRSGQKQKGIDLYCESDASIVGQCKNYYHDDIKTTKALIKAIDGDLEQAKEQKIPINNFFILTSMDSDVKVQDHINELIASEIYSFNIHIRFWDHIQAVLIMNELLIKKYYPFLLFDTSIPKKILNEVITALYNIRIQVDYFSGNKSYRAGINYNSDIEVYNNCVSLYNSILSINQSYQAYYLQFKELNVQIDLEILCRRQPKLNDASSDYYGGNLIATISSFISFYSEEENVNEIKKICDIIIEKLSI